MNASGDFKRVVFAIEKQLLLNHHPGLIDRGVMFGISEHATLEMLTVLADVLNTHISLTEDLCMVEDEMYNIYESMVDAYCTTDVMDEAFYDALDDYQQELFGAVITLRTMIPLQATNLGVISNVGQIGDPGLFYIGGVLHNGAIPEDYLFNEHYFAFM